MSVFAGTPQSPSASAYVESQGRMPHENLPRVSVIRGTLTETCMVLQTAYRICLHIVHSIDIYIWCAVFVSLFMCREIVSAVCYVGA